MIRSDNDRRHKVLFIHPNDILRFTIDWSKKHYGDCIAQVRFMDLPEETIIDHVWWDDMNMRFGMVLYHPSFPIVPPSKDPPIVQSTIVGYYLPGCNNAKEAMKLSEVVYGNTILDRLGVKTDHPLFDKAIDS